MPLGVADGRALRVGIVGCGRMGHVHARILKSLPGVAVCGVADADIEKAAHLAETVPVARAFGGAAELIDEVSPDIVHVLTPPPTHAQLCCAALEAGCHVFVEKPMAMTEAEARGMIAAARHHDRLLTVDHNNRFDPTVLRAHAMVLSGAIGELAGVDIFHNSLPAEAPWVAKLPSGDWFNDIDHLFYLAEFFLGPVARVRPVSTRSSDGRVVELHVAAENERGWSSLTYSTLTAPFQIRLRLYGRRRTLEVDLMPGLLLVRREVGTHRWLKKGVMILDTATQLFLQAGLNSVRVLTAQEKGWGGLRNLLNAFYAAIRNHSRSPVDLETCLRIVNLKQDIILQLHG
ncbi:MAG: Gfo/Idh/MocA family oxidoreductase [Alphaproteobacteria bacterium]